MGAVCRAARPAVKGLEISHTNTMVCIVSLSSAQALKTVASICIDFVLAQLVHIFSMRDGF